MADTDERPPVWIGHVTLATPDLDGTHEFMVRLGMRPIARGEGFAVFELRGGTHLVLLPAEEPCDGPADFDLMVEDIDATRAHFEELGLAPSAVRTGKVHRSFTVKSPSGHAITFNSNHVSSRPV